MSCKEKNQLFKRLKFDKMNQNRRDLNMKSKGFTLIELLAVIVILAVIALIATPLIMGTITKPKETQ